jgi:hypothetical protein
MPRVFAGLSEPDLERELLRKGLGALSADRNRCADCGRTPLIGEQIHRYARGTLVCELCRVLRADDPISTDLVRHSEHGLAVRVTRAA